MATDMFSVNITVEMYNIIHLESCDIVFLETLTKTHSSPRDHDIEK